MNFLSNTVIAIVFSAGLCGCYSDNFNLKVPVDLDLSNQLPLSVGLYLSLDNDKCDYARRSLWKSYHSPVYFNVAEMTERYWPEVFQSAFLDVQILADGLHTVSQDTMDILIEIRCEDFWIDTYGRVPWSHEFNRYQPWTEGGLWIILDYVFEFSCPHGEKLETYEIRGYSKLLYTEGSTWTGMLPPLKRKTRMTFQKAGDIFAEEVLPIIEDLVLRCPAQTQK